MYIFYVFICVNIIFILEVVEKKKLGSILIKKRVVKENFYLVSIYFDFFC